MLTDENTASHVPVSGNFITWQWYELFFLFINYDNEWDMVSVVQSWNQMGIGSMKALSLTIIEQISDYHHYWKNDGSHVLEQQTHSLYS